MVAAAADTNPVGAWTIVSIQRQLALSSVALSFVLSTGLIPRLAGGLATLDGILQTSGLMDAILLGLNYSDKVNEKVEMALWGQA